MKITKTSLAIAVALAAGVGTSAFAASTTTAYLTKQDTISLALTLQGQASVSTSATSANAGNFSAGPLYYKTSTSKFTQANLLKSIAYVLHSGNAGFYSSQATLELVQGELGGFWSISPALAQSYPDYAFTNNNRLTGSFNSTNTATFNYDYSELEGVFFPELDKSKSFDPYGYDSGLYAFEDYIVNEVDNQARTSIADGVNEFSLLDSGRHFLPVPWASYDSTTETGTPYNTTGNYPVGHMQPWGQVYVKDPGHKDASGNPLCENVTFFFDFCVQECYDCFYLSSFISDASFKNVSSTQVGPPCCTTPGYLTGKGTDRYYLKFNFDNTLNNSFLNPAIRTNVFNTGVQDDNGNDIWQTNIVNFYNYVGFTGIAPTVGAADGLSPDVLPYSDSIRSQLGTPSTYETRFTLNGIVTYNWTLKKINSSDIFADYIGTATYAANGYGFIALVCDLITGSASFVETAVKDTGCCDDETWSEASYNTTFNNTYATGWFGPGWNYDYGFFNPYYYQYDPYPYAPEIGGFTYSYLYYYDLPYQFESPLNPATAITEHSVDYGSNTTQDWSDGND